MCHRHLPCTNLELVQKAVMSALICQPHNVSSAVFGQLGCSVPAQHMADCQLLCEFQAQLTCSAAIPWLNRNLSAQLHTVMDLQVCEPDLATASPSAIAGCTDKLEFCKLEYLQDYLQ